MQQYKQYAKQYKRYLILCAYSFAVCAGFLAFDGILGVLYLVFAVPVFSLIGGLLAYFLARKVIFPTVLQLIVSSVLVTALWFWLFHMGAKIGEMLAYAFWGIAIYHVIMFCVACVTKLIVGLVQKRKQSSNQKIGET